MGPEELLIRGGTVVTMDAERRVRRADVLLRGQRIAAVGRTVKVASRPSVTIDASGCIVLPGLIQSHIHLCQTVMRGLADDLPPRQRDPAEEPIREVEVWDLVSAFGRLMRDTEAAKPSNIVYDDTPIHVYMGRIHARLLERGRLAFGDLFERGMHKSTLIGIFLACLELVRHSQVRLEQNDLFGEIWLLPNLACTEPLDLSSVDDYEGSSQ